MAVVLPPPCWMRQWHRIKAFMDTASPKVSASGILAIANYLLQHRLATPADVEQVLGEPLAGFQDPDRRVPVTTQYAFWDYARKVSGDPALGLHIGEIVEPDRMGLVGHIFFNCDTLQHALKEYTRLRRLVNEAVEIGFRHEGELAILSWQCHNRDDYCVADMERTVSAAVARARHFIHRHLHIREVRFAHPDPGYANEYQRIFQCPVVFGAAETALHFDSHYLQWRLPHRNPYLYKALLAQVDGLLIRLEPPRVFSRRVRKLISRQLTSEKLDADHLAQQLNMSRQTLYRKLKREGHGFQELVEEVRRDKAIRYVAEGRYALSEIAFLLGFSELSAFSRAFKRWTGESPARYRTRHGSR